MKLAFSTNAYTRHDLDFALTDIAAAGFGGVEILADRPHAYVDDLTDDAIDAIRTRVFELGLAVSNVNANCTFAHWSDPPPEPIFEPSLCSDDPDLRRVRAKRIWRTLDFATRIGADCISITTGKPLGAMNPTNAWEELKRQLDPLLLHAHDCGVKIGIEQEPGLLIEWSEEIATLAQEMGSPLLGANLDTGHCAAMGEDPAAAVRNLAGRIWNLHVEDLPVNPAVRTRRVLKHYHCDPGTGGFDFAGLFTALRETGYDRFATVELYTQTHRPAEAARASYGYLTSHVRV